MTWPRTQEGSWARGWGGTKFRQSFSCKEMRLQWKVGLGLVLGHKRPLPHPPPTTPK